MSALTAGLMAAIVPGLVSAVITRLLMSAIAAVTSTNPSFDPVNSLGIAVFYVAVLLPGCLALALSRGRWSWLLFGGGVLLLSFQAVAIGLQETASMHDMTATRWTVLVLALLAMLATYVVQVFAAAHLARRKLLAAGGRGSWAPTPMSAR